MFKMMVDADSSVSVVKRCVYVGKCLLFEMFGLFDSLEFVY